MIFDIDVYKSENEYLEFIKDAQKECYVVLTNPCFEVWLLLHDNDAYNKYIKDDEKNILSNKKTGKSTSNTYTSKLFSKNYGFNPKKKHLTSYIRLLDSIDEAIIEERNINNEIENAYDSISSNIGKLIEEMRRD